MQSRYGENNMRSKLGYGGALALCCAGLFISLVLACFIGSGGIGFSDAARALLKRIPFIGELFHPSVNAQRIMNYRLPGVLSAALVGGALAVCGCVLQGLFKNPMADTGVLGVSSGAGLGATIAIVCSLNTGLLGTGAVTLFAFIGGLLSVALIYALSRIRSLGSPVGLLLSGVCVSSLLTAVQTLIMLLGNDKVQSVFSWTMGSFSASSFEKLAWAAPLIIIGCILMFLLARPLDLMLMGGAQAEHMGVNVRRVTVYIMLLTALVCSAAVAISGIISFVGLIIPHILRLIFGPGHRRLIPPCFIVGAAFMTLTHLLARTLGGNLMLPVGVFTSILGAPFFLWLLSRKEA